MTDPGTFRDTLHLVRGLPSLDGVVCATVAFSPTQEDEASTMETESSWMSWEASNGCRRLEEPPDWKMPHLLYEPTESVPKIHEA